MMTEQMRDELRRRRRADDDDDDTKTDDGILLYFGLQQIVAPRVFSRLLLVSWTGGGCVSISREHMVQAA